MIEIQQVATQGRGHFHMNQSQQLSTELTEPSSGSKQPHSHTTELSQLSQVQAPKKILDDSKKLKLSTAEDRLAVLQKTLYKEQTTKITMRIQL